MTLFNFLKRKPTQAELDINEKNGFELVNDGILFEETKLFLRWWTDIEELLKQVGGRKERRSDRTIYHWGEHTILNGLALDLTTVYWDHIAGDDVKRFIHIEFLSMGNQHAEKQLELITAHLKKQLSSPVKGKLSEPDISLGWKTKDVIFSLEYYERYAYKLHFVIKRII